MAVTKELLEKRLIEVNQAIEQSAGNHNALLGRQAEVQYQLSQLFQAEIEERKSQVIEGD